jgi:hypothetical protein
MPKSLMYLLGTSSKSPMLEPKSVSDRKFPHRRWD